MHFSSIKPLHFQALIQSNISTVNWEQISFAWSGTSLCSTLWSIRQRVTLPCCCHQLRASPLLCTLPLAWQYGLFPSLNACGTFLPSLSLHSILYMAISWPAWLPRQLLAHYWFHMEHRHGCTLHGATAFMYQLSNHLTQVKQNPAGAALGLPVLSFVQLASPTEHV